MSNAAGSRTDAQIIESLHLCRHPHTGCKRCAYHGEILCDDKLKRDASALIAHMDKTITERDALLAVLGVGVPEGREGIE